MDYIMYDILYVITSIVDIAFKISIVWLAYRYVRWTIR